MDFICQHRTAVAMLFGFLAFQARPLEAGDWRQFRGSHANGVAAGEIGPPELSGEHIAWVSELPGRGLSGPVVVGDRVIVSCSSGYRQDRLHVLCFDDSNGELLWERQFWATGRTNSHNKMCNATPTPASDGERIFAFFSSNDLICLDLDGNLQWLRGLTHDYPNASNSLGMASSPIVVGDTLVVQVESDADSLAFGLNTKSGTTRWRHDRPRKANWSSPTLLPLPDRKLPLVVLQSATGLKLVDAHSGEAVGEFGDGASTIPSSTVAGQTIYAPSNGLTALRVGDDDKLEVLWNSNRLSPSTASPLVYRDHVYALNRAGVLACGDSESGELKWQLRLKGPYSSTPVVAGDRMYFFNEDGYAHIVDISGEKGEIVSEMDFADTILCTPAIAHGGLYVRSDQRLWKIK